MMPVWGLASLVVAVAVLCAVVELKLEEATESPVDERKEKKRTIETKRLIHCFEYLWVVLEEMVGEQ
ncbi:UNVERIFIED_CONTAM: hypothetical protein K2H54_043627 [Gekko kuhli]